MSQEQLNREMSPEEYQSRVVLQHNQIITQNNEIIALLQQQFETARRSDDAVTASLSGMRQALMSALKVPIAAVMIAAVSWLFYFAKISEHTWTIFCLVSMFPWFGDGVRIVVDMFRGRDGTAKEKAVAVSKLIALTAAALSLLMGCDTPRAVSTATAAFRDYPMIVTTHPEGE